MFKIVCRVQIKFVISFPFFPSIGVAYDICVYGRTILGTLITHGRTHLNKTLFLRTFHDQYRRRQVVDQCSLWKERPLEWYNRARLLINMRHSFKLTRIELEIYITFATQIKPYCLSNLASYCLSFPILMERVVTSNEFHWRAIIC